MTKFQQLNRNSIPGDPAFHLPEKVLQFGTGVLLRALPDFLIHQANQAGFFNGRIVAVKSTGQGNSNAFQQQDSLYTVCIRGIEKGHVVSTDHLCTAISRTLLASGQWQEVLTFAQSDTLQIVLSNTTEVGLQLVREDIFQSPPASFPGKLLAVLYARFQHFAGAGDKGLVIIPTELIPENGKILQEILLELAGINRLESAFVAWLNTACTFCNSLVDRIVPGKPAGKTLQACFATLGYEDDLLTFAEPYALWAIEGNEQTREILSFGVASPESVFIEPDITRYRERKLRLLNAVHTLSCGLAIAAGFQTVSEAMQHPAMAQYIEKLMFREIAPAIPYPLPAGDAETFGQQVLDRFRNPFVQHFWKNITVQYSAKMRMRNVPLVLEHYRKHRHAPELISLGFASWLYYFQDPDREIQDEQASYLRQVWKMEHIREIVETVLANENLWGQSLAQLPGLASTVTFYLLDIQQIGMQKTLEQAIS